MKRRNVEYFFAFSASLITFIIYLSSLQNSFVEWDDSAYVFENPHIRSLGPAFFRWAFFDFYAANWHPLTWISHALDYAVWGLNPLGHHLTNNILHALNTFLVVLLAVRLIASRQAGKLTSSHDSRFTLVAAGVTGLLFGLHPIHVESVAWVAERKDLLCALFFLLSVLKYMSYVSHKTYKTYILALCFFVLALMSKPMAVSLPVVLLILDWYPLNRLNSLKTLRTRLVEKIPFFALSIFAAVVTILAQKSGLAMGFNIYVPLWGRLLVSLKALVAYLWNMVLPLHLMPFYKYPLRRELWSFEYLLAAVAVAGITTFSLAISRRQKVVPAAWCYYVVTLIPVLGIVQVGGQSMADRYTYLPSLAPFLLAGLLASQLYNKGVTPGKWKVIFRAGGFFAGIAVSMSLVYVTLLQVGVWKNSLTLWTYVIEHEPLRVPHAYNNRGFIFLKSGAITQAIEDFQIAARLDPTNWEPHNNLCLAYKSKGLYENARQQCETAITLKPDDAEAHNNLGVVFGHEGLYDKAIEHYQIALRLKPDYAEAHFNLGIVYLNGNALDLARTEFEAGLKIKPDDAKAQQVLGQILSRITALQNRP